MATENQRTADEHEGGGGRDAAWQERLLPLMVRIVVQLALFFFFASFVQLAYLQWHLQNEPASLLTSLDWAQEDPARVGVAAWLESDVIARRYRMVSALMMAQLWIRYMGFVTGMIMAIIGAVFILGKMRERSSEVKLGSTAVQVSMATASPGLLLAVVGSVLMLATILTKQESSVTDAAVYMPAGWSVTSPRGTEMADELTELLSRVEEVEDKEDPSSEGEDSQQGRE